MGVFAAPFQAPRGSAIRELYPYLLAPGHDFVRRRLSIPGGVRRRRIACGDGAYDARAARALAAIREHARRGAAARGAGPGWRDGASAQRPDEVIVTTGSRRRSILSCAYSSIPAIPCSSSGRTPPRCRRCAMRARRLSPSAPTVKEWTLSSSSRCSKHRGIKAIYTLPTFGNPTGATMPLARRKRLWTWPRAITPWSSKTTRTEIQGSTARTCRPRRTGPRACRSSRHPFQDRRTGLRGGVDAGASRDRAALRHRQADRGPVHVALDSGRGRALHPLRRAGAAPAAHHRRGTGSRRMPW